MTTRFRYRISKLLPGPSMRSVYAGITKGGLQFPAWFGSVVGMKAMELRPWQLKHLPTETILRFLAQHQGRWSTWGKGYTMPTVSSVLPGVPDEMVIKKMANLIRRGLSGGCWCGCRGDYEITDKGLALIGVPRTKPYNGY